MIRALVDAAKEKKERESKGDTEKKDTVPAEIKGTKGKK